MAAIDIQVLTSDSDIYKLHINVKKGRWNEVKSYLSSVPGAISWTSSSTRRTVLHVAVAAGQVEMVKELTELGDVGFLRMQDHKGYTALAIAAKVTDDKKMAEYMVNKGGNELLSTRTNLENIPLILALDKGHTEMTRYLFSETPWSFLLEHKNDYGPKIISGCISAGIFDVAAALLQHQVGLELPLNANCVQLRPLYALANMPSAFRSGAKLGRCSRLVYKILILRGDINLKDKCIKIGSHVEPINSLAGQFFERFRLFIQPYLLKIPRIERIYLMKMNHHLVLDILQSLCGRISAITSESDLHACSAYDALLQAAKYGIVEFIDSMRLANPDLLWANDKDERGVFSHAIINRQEKVFQLIHDIEGLKEFIIS